MNTLLRWYRKLPTQTLRWRVMAYYGRLLTFVLAGFGGVAWNLQSINEAGHLDAELQLRVSALLGNIANHPRPEPPRNGAEHPPPPPREEEEHRHGPPPGNFRFRPELGPLFAPHGDQTFYYRVWARDGRVISESENAPPDLDKPPRQPGHGVTFHDRADQHEALEFTPPGECVIVGISRAGLDRRLWRYGEGLVAVGLAILVLGLAGGWWMASQATAPVRAIRVAAGRIAGGKLDERIQRDPEAGELDELAGLLNHTFAQLDAAFAEQARFTSDAAHELRTPVAVILAQTQLALARPRQAEEYRDSIEITRRAALRVKGLIESLLTLARLDARSETPHNQPCDLALIAREQIDLVRPLADERGITLRPELASVPCYGDPERLAQICINLLSNAVKYNRADGEVRIITRQADAWCLLSVSDDGPGIAAEHLPHLFQRFYRADASRSRATGGAGLGLAICRTLAESQGGRLTVASVESQGSTFTLQLPVSAVPGDGGAG